MIEKRNSFIPGILFILIGLVFLAKRVFDIDFFWPRLYPILMGFIGVILIIEMARQKRSGPLFWGVILITLGSFFFARNYDIIPYFYVDEYWPVFMLALGLGFVAMFLYNPRDWGSLIPAALFLFFGLGFSMRTFHGYAWGLDRFVETYWPFILVIIGGGIVIRSLFQSDKD